MYESSGLHLAVIPGRVRRAQHRTRFATAICVALVPTLAACSDAGDTIIVQVPSSAGAGGMSGSTPGSGGNVATGGSASGQGGSSGSGPVGGAPSGGAGAGDGGSGTGAGASAGGVAGIDSGGSSSGGVPGGECNAVATGPDVVVEQGLGEPPIAIGGSVSDGTYRLTRSIDYTNACDCTHSATLVISGGATHYEANFDGERSSGALSVFTGWLGFTPSCPLGVSAYTRDFIGYVTGIEFVDHDDDRVDEFTLD